MNESALTSENALLELLQPHLIELVDILSTEKRSQYQVEIPTAQTMDLPIEELSSLVARTSNVYGRLAYFAGVARAQAKIAKGQFERMYKRSRGQGKNDKEREAFAMESSHELHSAAIMAEAVAELADSLENAARLASESARKIFDKANAINVASARESHGRYQDRDFSPY